MAEAKTKTKSKQAKPKPKAKSRAKPKARKRPSSASAKSNGARKTPKRSASKQPSKPQAVLNSVEETAKDAGDAVGSAASKVGHAAAKAKVPLMASGAVLAGAAGGLALGSRAMHRRNGFAGVKSKDLAKVAKRAGGAGLRVGELALEGQRSETRNGNGKTHRSPVEVVLEGLTSRR